jgi:hypothetical protein
MVAATPIIIPKIKCNLVLISKIKNILLENFKLIGRPPAMLRIDAIGS